MDNTNQPQNSIRQSVQQLSYPLDYASIQVIKEALGTTNAFPVGAIYTSTVSTNPAATFGYGTWVAFGAGKVLVGYLNGDSDFGTGGNQGGEKTHTLITAEMPSHTHAGVLNTGGGSQNLPAGGGVQSGSTNATGGDGAHNNLQPFIVVYFWKRTA